MALGPRKTGSIAWWYAGRHGSLQRSPSFESRNVVLTAIRVTDC